MNQQQRLIPGPEAALFVGCKDYQQFYREWKQGFWPDPYPVPSRPLRWDRILLEQHLDKHLNQHLNQPNGRKDAPANGSADDVAIDPLTEFN